MGSHPGFELLAEAARALHTELDHDRLVAWAADGARKATVATSAGVWIPGSGWTTASNGATGERLLDGLGDLARASSPGLRRLLREGGVLSVDNLFGTTQDARDLGPLLAGAGSMLAVNVPRRAHALDGVIAVASSVPGRFSEEAASVLGAVAAHLGVALDNLEQRRALEQARATERQLVDQLQTAVVPARPEVPFTELGAFYSPAEPGAYTGGDLHDWIILPGGDLHFAIVDVMGKGVAATKDALSITHVLRLLVIDGCPLDQVVQRADAIVTAQNPDLVATLLVGAYRPDTGCLKLAGGGHPPALLVRNERAVALAAPGVPIGWPGAGSEGVVETQLERGDTVILYTDGLIEGSKDILKGMSSLTRFAEDTAAYPAQQQARVLIERALAGAARRDDSLALVLRCRGRAGVPTRHPLGPFEHRLSHSMAAVSVARGLLREWLIRVPVEGAVVQDLLLVATELCANAVEHARWSGVGVVLRSHVEGDNVILEVEDDGSGLAWPYLGTEPPDPSAEEGRGLWLVQTFCDEVDQRASDAGTVVRCVRNSAVSPDWPGGGTEVVSG